MGYALVFLVLSSAVSLSGPETTTAFGTAYPGALQSIRDVEKGRKNSRIFEVNGHRVLVGYATDPLPPAIFEHALENDESWQEGAAAFDNQAGHVVIAVDHKAKDHKELAGGTAAVTLLAAALSSALPVSAALFADSELVVDPNRLRERATALAEQGVYPIDLWVSTHPFYLDDSKRTKIVLTLGLSPFVGREIEISSETAEFDALAQRASDLSQYLIKNGPVVADGHTFGYSATDRIRVRHLDEGLSGVPVYSMFVEEAQAVLPQ